MLSVCHGPVVESFNYQPRGRNENVSSHAERFIGEIVLPKLNLDEPCCRTCAYWMPVESIHSRDLGDCAFPPAKLPDAYCTTLPPLLEGVRGRTCSTWEEKK